jgi:hypothetical protein
MGDQIHQLKVLEIDNCEEWRRFCWVTEGNPVITPLPLLQIYQLQIWFCQSHAWRPLAGKTLLIKRNSPLRSKIAWTSSTVGFEAHLFRISSILWRCLRRPRSWLRRYDRKESSYSEFPRYQRKLRTWLTVRPVPNSDILGQQVLQERFLDL